MSSLAADVLGWGEPRLRDLPWRRTRDRWEVLVSEVMLQQTQVSRVIDRWPRFLERFPTPAMCAAAPLADVLIEWQGLGYPRRARNLHRTARIAAERGGLPGDLEGLLALPGVGPYTARAVMAFADEADVAVVDTNIARLCARLVGERLTAKPLQAFADSMVPAGEGWSWNQCLMDLGALVCRPTPRCVECPVARHCAWRGDPARPDPAIGTSGVSVPQAAFEGSDRQARGRLLKRLGEGPLPVDEAPAVMHRSADAANDLIAALVTEGLCERSGNYLRLPA